MLDFAGAPFPADLRKALEDFCLRVEAHPQGGPVEGRIVLAKDEPEGMTKAVRKYMDSGEFSRWLKRQPDRTVATGGKTFVSDDGVITAVLLPVTGQVLLDLAAHETGEMARSAGEAGSGFITPTDPDEADGLTLFGEYRVERVRQEISVDLGWPEGAIVATQSLRPMVEEIRSRMPAERADRPALDFYGAWLEMAQCVVMACGRADAGSRSASEDLVSWAEHRLVADEGWTPIHRSLGELFSQPDLGPRELPPLVASVVRRPVLGYARDAWRLGP